MEELVNLRREPSDEGYDSQIASLAAQSANLCNALATKLEMTLRRRGQGASLP